MPLSGPYIGIGVAPQVTEAFADATNRVRVLFSEPMRADAALQDPASYVITPDGGSDARVVTAVSLEPTAAPTYVILVLDGDLTVGVDNYNVAVDPAIEDVAHNPIDPAHDDADFSGDHASTTLDHCAAALARLLQQFKGRPKLEATICALTTGAQDLEQAMVDTLAFRSLGTAFGAQLDRLGETLRQPRDGLTDAAYRIILQAKVLVLSSKGHADELIAILLLLDDGFAPSAITYAEHHPAAYVLTCDVPAGGQLIGERFARLLREAKPTGVYYHLDFQEEDTVLFTWAFVAGSDAAPPADSGWEEESSPGIGGVWAESSSGVNT